MISLPTTTDEARWTAVLERDPMADGAFVYAVASTRIYCRPSCPSRRPRRTHVRFFPTPADAEAEGFRACLRCRPRDGETAAEGRVRAARAYLDGHLDETVTLERLGAEVGMSPHHLQRTFRRLTGLSPKAYADARRLERLKTRLREGDSVTRATYEAGYTSSSRAYDHTRARLGMTPAAYRRGGGGVRIRTTTVPTAVGSLLVAATEHGICAVALGDSAEALEAALRREFPAAEIEPGGDDLREWVAAVVDGLEGRPAARVPLDVRGTTFQRQVWDALLRIPPGETLSYGELARRIGRPTAARAVAGACADNRLALLIPCHRAVRGSGALGGYRWGVERKQALLERERASAGDRGP